LKKAWFVLYRGLLTAASLHCWRRCASFCISGITASAPKKLIWPGYAGTFFSTTNAIRVILPNDL
jgi:hypothetical protein